MAENLPSESTNSTSFQDAVEALRRGERGRAKDLLTTLLRADQGNANYWVWLSATMDSTKEIIYCLQTALKLDPENHSSKRGLVLMGALAPDESIQPFSVNRPRAWEEKLLLANEKPREKGLKVLARNPAFRLAGMLVLAVGLCAAVVFGFILPNRMSIQPTRTNTPGPSPTFTPTPTIFGAVGLPTATYIGPTPLWMFLPATYTPTPLYVNTPRDPLNFEQSRSAKAAYEQRDWDAYIQYLRVMARNEPNSADIHYYIGEAYRFKGQASEALEAYNNALRIDPDFGPPYLGLARARLIQDPNVNIEYLFDEAIVRDPNFGEIYLERARYFLYNKNPEAAIVDLNRADQLLPGSADVQLGYAYAYQALEDQVNALQHAESAYNLDITNLPVYLLLGELYIDGGDYQSSLDPLELYVVYKDEDARAFALLGRSHFELGNYQAAITTLDDAISLDPVVSRRYYVYRGLSHLELGDVDKAAEDLNRAFEVSPQAYNVNLGLVRVYFLQEKFGTAFQKVEALQALTTTDEEIALTLYWRALIQEKRGEQEDAIRTWQDLLTMDPRVLSSEMRLEVERHLREVVTPTNTPRPGTRTPTPRP